MSLRTSDRPTALRLGVGALAVFEELLSMEIEDGLIHLMERIIQEMDLQPEDMTGEDLIRRRALQMIGKKLIRRVGDASAVDAMCPPLREEFVHFNHATVRGEVHADLVQKRAAGMNVVVPPRRQEPDLTALREALHAFLGTDRPDGASIANGSMQTTGELATLSPTPPVAGLPEIIPAPIAQPSLSTEPGWTMRALLDDYMRRDGKQTGADNKSNLNRAVELFEAVLPRGKIVSVTDIVLKEWDDLYDFMQKIPKSRGKHVDDLFSLTRRMIESGEKYETLSSTTLNSNYTGALVRLIQHGNGRRVISMTPPNLVTKSKKRAASGKPWEPFSPSEITAVTRCPVYVGSRSAHYRYTPGNVVTFDDHIYWAPLIAMHSGMRVSEIGMLQIDQFQEWFGRPTIVLEISDDDAADGEGYKTKNALRRVPLHRQLIDIGLQDFVAHQQRKGSKKLFPDWTKHVKGGANGEPEVHYEADFFNDHRSRWNVPAERHKKLAFHSFRRFFIQACHSAKIDPYTALKMVGHDDGLKAQVNDVHANYMGSDLTAEEVGAIDGVVVPLGQVQKFQDLVRRYGL